MNTTSLSSKLAKLQKQQPLLEKELNELKMLFAENIDQQDLLLAISETAQRSGIRILQQTGSTVVNDGTNQTTKPLIDKASGRPLIRLVAEGGYWQLLDFLDGLNDQLFAVAPLGIQLGIADSKGVDDKSAPALPPGFLEIQLVLSL